MSATTPSPAEIPTREELVARAAGLVPVLRERAVAADAARRIPDETFADLTRAGLLRLSTPREYGGYGLPMRDYVDVIAELARGCSSTAWVASIMASSSWEAGGFPAAAQDEVFGVDPDVRVVSVPQARAARAELVDGGLRIHEAQWFFCSGSPWATWAAMGVPITDRDGQIIDQLLCLIPIADLDVRDDWHTMGMRATQSNSVRAADVFVPEHRLLSTARSLGGDVVHEHGPDQPLYFSPPVPTLALFVHPNGIGMAKAALEHFLAGVRGKPLLYTSYADQSQIAATSLHAGEAALKIDAAEALVHASAEAIDAAARGGGAMDWKRRVRVRAQGSYALQLCFEAVDLLYANAGGSAIHERNPLQRVWRDCRTATMHGLLAPSVNREGLGNVLLDRDQIGPFV
jgi:3-hydroxy-9,10-secoandrosta-1,3,5(10)-triene-9,17-dione monooxygenase